MIPVKRWRLNTVSLKCHLYEEGGAQENAMDEDGASIRCHLTANHTRDSERKVGRITCLFMFAKFTILCNSHYKERTK